MIHDSLQTQPILQLDRITNKFRAMIVVMADLTRE